MATAIHVRQACQRLGAQCLDGEACIAHVLGWKTASAHALETTTCLRSRVPPQLWGRSEYQKRHAAVVVVVVEILSVCYKPRIHE